MVEILTFDLLTDFCIFLFLFSIAYFLGSPNLVVLDEPCAGVDIKARKNIWDLISVLRKGRAVALATHYLDEAERLSDSILIMNEVRIWSLFEFVCSIY